MAAADRRDLLRDIQSVAFAAEKLRESVDAGEPATQIGLAVERLERAAQIQGESATRVRTFRFEALEDPDQAPETRADAADEVLSLAASDLHVGAVLFAAGQAVGEAKPADGSAARRTAPLDSAIAELGATTRELGQDVEQSSRYRFGAPAPQPSADLPKALAGFEDRASTFLDLVTSELVGIAGKIADKIPLGDIADAVKDIGVDLPVVKAAGRLIKLAVAKVKSAFDALAGLIGDRAFAALRDPIANLVTKVRDAGFRGILAALVDVDGTMAYVRSTVSASSVAPAVVDRASAEIMALEPRYKRCVKYVNLTIGAGALLSTLAGPPSVLGSVGIALIFMSLVAAVALAKDYADSENWLRFVRGVREIADDVHAAG